MKILLFGQNGQVGWELQRALAPLGELIALDRSSQGGLCGDLSNLDGIAETIKRVAPDVIVNAAAYTAVDKAESEPELAERINVQAVRVMAHEAVKLNALLVHYSTDYVFNGSGDRPWQETDQTAPLSVYGRTKLEGEQAIIDSRCAHLILRTSWVYAARGQNFAKTMLRLAVERDVLNVIDDQIGAPTGAELISDVSAHAIRAVRSNPALSGVYHLAAAGETSWWAYAQFVFEVARRQGRVLKVTDVKPIPTSQYPTPATRPLNSRLDTTRLASTFGLSLPHWKKGVERMLNELKDDGV
jgi:dTDP-4-dehydrorhamnose reductase